MTGTCTNTNVHFDNKFWFGNYKDNNLQVCGNTATTDRNYSADQLFASNYTAWKAYVTEKEPYAYDRLCTVIEPGFPDLRVWINVEHDLFPTIGVYEAENDISGYQIGIIRLERNKIDGDYRLFAPPKGNVQWGTMSNHNSSPQVQYCIG
ncbi:hypothetical protein N0V90_005984 [Kalmusia sp. IMI 367209]|nr:hypothetical protein N0V90_005984 [Kalmusia sp. IMI 367209]